MDLSMLKPGQSGVVSTVGNCPGRAKMVEMGLFKGKLVKVIFRAPFGDPIAVSIDGYVLALRKEEASAIALDNIIR